MPTHSPDLSSLEYEAGLIGLLPVLEIVKTIIYTGQVKGERPASALIIAPIGAGKTSVLEKIVCETAEFTSDFTAREASPIVQNDALSHVMIGDLLSVLDHKAGTVKLSLNVLAKLTGDTLLTDPFSGRMIKPKRMGCISAIPPGKFDERKTQAMLMNGGLASRFIIIRYHYTPETIRRIHDFIKSDAYTRVRPYELKVERGAFEIKIPAHIADKIELLTRAVKNDSVGARAHHHLRALVKARARMRDSNMVEDIDFAFVEQVSDFFAGTGRTI